MVVVRVKRNMSTDDGQQTQQGQGQQAQSEPPKEPPVEERPPSVAGFEFNELNRAVEVAQWFEWTIVPLLKRRGVPDETVAGLSVAFATKLSEAVIRKYITTVATINLEKAIEIIDEELPKLIKQSQSSLDIDSVLKTWGLIKEILAKGGRNA